MGTTSPSCTVSETNRESNCSDEEKGWGAGLSKNTPVLYGLGMRSETLKKEGEKEHPASLAAGKATGLAKRTKDQNERTLRCETVSFLVDRPTWQRGSTGGRKQTRFRWEGKGRGRLRKIDLRDGGPSHDHW